MAADDDSDLEMSVPPPSITNSSPSAGRAEETQRAASMHSLQPLANDADLLNVYHYDTTLRLDLPPLDSNADEPNYFAGIKKWDDEKEVRVTAALIQLVYIS